MGGQALNPPLVSKPKESRQGSQKVAPIHSEPSDILDLKRFMWVLVLIWTLAVAAFLGWHYQFQRKNLMEIAHIQALSAFERDLMYRHWNSTHGGVYVPITDKTPPNPHLARLPERDVITPSGRKLTLLNPAYMTREVHEMAAVKYGQTGHITSLKPLRPENLPDDWECKALESFQQGAHEYSAIVVIDNKKYLRFMRPLMTEQSCLACHGDQGYKVGEVRGGIGVTVPLEPLWAIENRQFAYAAAGHGFLWLLGLVGIVLGFKRLRRSETARNMILAELNQAKDELEIRVEERTEALRKNSLLLERFFSSSVFSVAYLDTEFNFIRVNPSYAGQIQKEPAFFSGKNLFDLHLNPEREDLLRKLAKTGDPYTAHSSPMEFPDHPERGVTYWDWALQPLKDEEGNIEGLILVLVEVSQRQKAEEELRQNEALIKAVMDNLPLGVAVNSLDPAVKFEYMNDNFPRFYRTTREALADPDNFWNAVYEDPDFREEIKKRALEDCASGDPERMHWDDVPLTREGAETTFINARNTPVPGKALMISTVWDVTERKKAEEGRKKLEQQLRQAQKMEAVGTLAGGIAHDFNNILAAIIGYTELSQNDLDKSHPCQRYLTNVLTAGGRAKNLVYQILSFSRQAEQKRLPIDIAPAVKEALKLLRASIPTTIEIEQDIALELGAALADPTRIHQVIMNLCTNAAYAMREKGGILTVKLSRIELDEREASQYAELTPGSYLRLTVSDTGHGMDRGTLERIFEPFFTTKKEEGTGLGLSVVHGIIKDHGGAITVYSEPGRGTTFHIYLPTQETEQVKPVKETALALPRGNEHILLVDDEAMLADIGRRMLEGLGYQVTALTSSQEALQLFKAEPDSFGLLITDQTMPHVTGLQLAQEIANVRPDIPIILCSGFSSQTSVEDIKTAGVKRFLAKPLLAREVAWAVRNALDEAVKIERAVEAKESEGRSLLFVDDEPAILDAVKRNFHKTGFNLFAAESGEEALRIYQENKGGITFVILDLTMPGMSGQKTLEELLKFDPAAKVIIATGHIDQRLEEEMLKAGAVGFVTKPYSKEDLLKKIREIIGV